MLKLAGTGPLAGGDGTSAPPVPADPSGLENLACLAVEYTVY